MNPTAFYGCYDSERKKEERKKGKQQFFTSLPDMLMLESMTLMSGTAPSSREASPLESSSSRNSSPVPACKINQSLQTLVSWDYVCVPSLRWHFHFISPQQAGRALLPTARTKGRLHNGIHFDSIKNRFLNALFDIADRFLSLLSFSSILQQKQQLTQIFSVIINSNQPKGLLRKFTPSCHQLLFESLS